MAKKENRRNEAITAPEVRVVSADSEQLGIMSIQDALQAAEDAGLELVEIAPNAEPPVCRIMDYGKHQFQKAKMAQDARKKQKQVQVKEIKFRPRTDIGDYNTKLRKLRGFLENGDRTKVTMRFRGREFAHQELGLKLLKRVEADLEDLASVEVFPKMEGRQMIMVLAPRKDTTA